MPELNSVPGQIDIYLTGPELQCQVHRRLFRITLK